MSRTTVTDRAGRRLHLLVASVACLGLAVTAGWLAGVAGVVGDPVAAPHWPWLGAYTLLIAGSHLLRVQVRIRSAWRGLTWADAVMLVGLATMPVPWVVLATPVGVLAARLIGRSPPIKTVFAVAKAAVLASVGGLVLSGLDSLGWPGVGWQVAWLAATFVVIAVLGQVCGSLVIALASRTAVTERFSDNWDITLVALAARLAVAIVAVLILQRQPQLAYALPLLVLLGHVWHEQWVRTREERRAWQDHAAAIASFTDVELDTVLRRAVTSGARLFSAEVFEVELWPPARERLVRGGCDAVTFDGHPADAPPDPERADVHAVPLRGYPGRPDTGALRMRFRDRVRLTEREDAMLATYVAALETAVRNATAYGQLRRSGSLAAPTDLT